MHTSITPVTVFPDTATILYVWNGFSVHAKAGEGTIPTFSYSLQNDARNELKNGEVSMTVDQWQAWDSTADDEPYILGCLATNLGVTIVTPAPTS